MQNTYQEKIDNLEANNAPVRKKLEGGIRFKIKSNFQPAGDQPEAIKKILKNAIIAGGSTINNYHNSEGKIGSYQKNFKVYDREGKGCLRNRCRGKIRRINRSGRSIFYCSICQT